jgi:hypothetical protein
MCDTTRNCDQVKYAVYITYTQASKTRTHNKGGKRGQRRALAVSISHGGHGRIVRESSPSKPLDQRPLGAHAFVLLPVLALVLKRAVLDEAALAACLAHDLGAARVDAAALGPLGAPTIAPGDRDALLAETHLAVDPVAHLPPLDALAEAAAALNVEDLRALGPAPREADHLAVVGAARVRAAGRVVEEEVRRGDVRAVGEDDLGVRGGLMREKDEEAGAFLVEEGAEGEVDLREAGGTALAREGVRDAHVVVLDLPLDAGLACATERVPADELEERGNIVHFLALEVGDDDIYLVAATVVHAP